MGGSRTGIFQSQYVTRFVICHACKAKSYIVEEQDHWMEQPPANTLLQELNVEKITFWLFLLYGLRDRSKIDQLSPVDMSLTAPVPRVYRTCQLFAIFSYPHFADGTSS